MIDWKKVCKVARELKVYPKECYNPCYLPFDSVAWFDLLSERSLGKTTGILLLGMIANKEFGTVPEYVRLTKEMIKPKKLQQLFEVITRFGYVERITDNKWNDVFYWSGFWYYCKRDDNKNIVEKSNKPFMHVYDLNSTNDLKSAYNNIDGDMIIVDEFIDNQTPYQDFFFYLCDSMSTIFRKRLGCKVFLLANTIDCRSVWFTEQGIMQDVSKMKIGDRKIITRDGMTPVYFEIIANTHNTAKQNFVDSYFNFKNPKLNSITGVDTWAYSIFPIYEKSYLDEDGYHRYKFDKIKEFFISHNGFYLKCVMGRHEKYDYCVYCTNWNITPHPDDIIIVRNSPFEKNEYNVREIPVLYRKAFCELLDKNKWYFRDNSSAMTFKSFQNDNR